MTAKQTRATLGGKRATHSADANDAAKVVSRRRRQVGGAKTSPRLIGVSPRDSALSRLMRRRLAGGQPARLVGAARRNFKFCAQVSGEVCACANLGTDRRRRCRDLPLPSAAARARKRAKNTPSEFRPLRSARCVRRRRRRHAASSRQQATGSGRQTRRFSAVANRRISEASKRANATDSSSKRAGVNRKLRGVATQSFTSFHSATYFLAHQLSSSHFLPSKPARRPSFARQQRDKRFLNLAGAPSSRQTRAS